jgi:hypothetical protein
MQERTLSETAHRVSTCTHLRMIEASAVDYLSFASQLLRKLRSIFRERRWAGETPPRRCASNSAYRFNTAKWPVIESASPLRIQE